MKSVTNIIKKMTLKMILINLIQFCYYNYIHFSLIYIFWKKSEMIGIKKIKYYYIAINGSIIDNTRAIKRRWLL